MGSIDRTEWCRLLDDAISWLPKPIRDEIEYESDSSQWSNPIEALSFHRIIRFIKEAELSMAMSLIEIVYETSEYAGALFLLRARVHFLLGEHEDMMSCLKHAADLNEDPEQVEQTTAELATLLNRITGRCRDLQLDVELNAAVPSDPTDERQIQIDSTSDEDSCLKVNNLVSVDLEHDLGNIRKELNAEIGTVNRSAIEALASYPAINYLVDHAKSCANQILTVDIDSRMERKNPTFHSHTNVLFNIAVAYCKQKDIILEIGVWRGHTPAVIHFIDPTLKYIGIDPLELPGQAEDVRRLISRLGGNYVVEPEYSSECAYKLLHLKGNVQIIHIDGAHDRRNVFNDFILYRDLLKPNGFLIFDDYLDFKHSPQVKLIIDDLEKNDYFSDFEKIGVTDSSSNYILVRR